MKLANYRWAAEKRAQVNRLSAREKRRKYSSKSSLTSIKTFDSCNEQPYVRTQLAIATSIRTSTNKQHGNREGIRRAKKHGTYRTRPGRLSERLAIASKLIKISKIIIVINHAYLLLTTFADPS